MGVVSLRIGAGIYDIIRDSRRSTACHFWQGGTRTSVHMRPGANFPVMQATQDAYSSSY